MAYIENNGAFPTEAGRIKLGIDKYHQTAEILDGNHRLTCASNMSSGSFPKYTKVQYQYGYFPNANKLPTCPDPENWPTFLCGCDIGFTTSDETH